VLVSPTAAGALPPSWPGTGSTPGTSGSDWSSMLMMMLPVMMMGTVVAATKSKENEREPVSVAVTEERKLLPAGRNE